MIKRLPYIIVFLLFWHLIAKNVAINFFISNPIDVALYAVTNLRSLGKSFFITMFEALSGLAIGVTFSYLITISCVYFPSILRPIKAMFVATQVLPIITLAPLFIVAFGMGIWSKVTMVSIMCFFPIFINLMAGIERVKSFSDDFLGIYQANLWFKLTRIYIPLSLPQAFVGLKVAATMAVLGAIVAEFLGAYYGLGKNLYSAPKNANAELMVSSAVLTAVMGIVIFRMLERIERQLTKWDSA